MKTFGTNLKKLREELGLTQKEFGQRLGFDARTISNWEKSRNLPSLIIIKRINTIYKADYEELFDIDDEFKI